jgi:hypothetical protein
MDPRQELAELEELERLMARAKPQNPDDNLGGTLKVGIPFTGARLDTRIPLSPEVESGIVGSGKTVARWVQGLNPFTQDAQVKEEERLYKPLAEKHPYTTTAGEIAPYLLTGNPLASAGLAAAEYGTPEERAMRAGLAFGGAKLGQGVARLFGPKSMGGAKTGEVADDFFDYGAGNKWGIPTTMGQNGNKTAALVESVVSHLPFGGAVNKARDASYGAFNQAVARTFGENTSKLSTDLVGEAHKQIGGKIGALAERNTLRADPEIATGFARLTQEANSELVGDSLAKFNKWAGIVEKKVFGAEDATLAGTQYRKLRTALNTAIKDSADGDTRRYLGLLKEQIEGAMDRSISKADSEAWKQANRQLFNVKQVGDAMAATPNELSQAKLLQSVNRSQRASRFGGGNDLAELARWGKEVLPDKVPNSGTAQRLFMQKLLTNPVGAGGGLLGVGYGANATGLTDINPAYFAAPVALPYLAARITSGKPVSEFTRKMLMRGGGLLGLGLAD